ncbi:MAG: RNA polymerase factor sigma-54 [Bacteroidales bacterium]|nr:RNA polymerase factor sigma-54 [Bacteroidales bacterium]
MAISQQQTLKQQQRLTQAQIQQIKMLEIPALEMEERILREIDSNPALEFGEDPEQADKAEDFETETDDSLEDESGDENDFPADDQRDEDPDDLLDYDNDYDDRAADYAETQPYDPNAEADRREPFLGVQTASLQEYLRQQLSDLNLDQRQTIIGEYIIGSIEEDGYLRTSLGAIADQLSFQRSMDVDETEMQQVLQQIQTFEPSGVAAKDLQECLLLQLKNREQSPQTELAIDILEHHFKDFSEQRYGKISQALDLDETQLDEVKKLISRLNPKPGNGWEASLLNESGRQITPDFLLENHDGKLELSLNDTSLPDLHVSRYYRQLARKEKSGGKGRSQSEREAVAFARQKVEAASWFINAIRQRQQTLMHTMQAIVDRQKDFFLSGEEKRLRPMKLKDVAADTGLDISTVSRVSNSKYIQTEFGIFPLKFFFSESMQTTGGEEVSVREIKTTLKEIIDAEDKNSPLTDDALVEMLQAKGYRIARRTVAKYREQLGIATSRLRTRR